MVIGNGNAASASSAKSAPLTAVTRTGSDAAQTAQRMASVAKAQAPVVPPASSGISGYEGIYQAQQAQAEKAFQDAQQHLASQKQQLYLDYGFGPDGSPDPNSPYGGYQTLEHNYGTSRDALDTAQSQTERDTGTRLSQLLHGYQSQVAGFDTAEGDDQTDASQQLDRLGRDYKFSAGGLDTQRSRLTEAFANSKQGALLSGADQLDAARASAIGRGLGTEGLGGRDQTRIRSGLEHGLDSLQSGYNADNADIDRSKTQLDTTYGDSTSDVRTQLSRALRDLGVARDQAGYAYGQDKSGLETALSDARQKYNTDLSGLDWQHGADKNQLGSDFLRALSDNGEQMSGAMADKTSTLAEARMALIKQAMANNDGNTQSLLKLFGYA